MQTVNAVILKYNHRIIWCARHNFMLLFISKDNSWYYSEQWSNLINNIQISRYLSSMPSLLWTIFQIPPAPKVYLQTRLLL